MVYCLAAWQALPRAITTGQYPNKEDALKVKHSRHCTCGCADQMSTGLIHFVAFRHTADSSNLSTAPDSRHEVAILLQAAAVVDRIRRALADVSDRVSSVVEPISTGLGKAFGVADWAVELFAEEVVRGGPAFALSLVCPWPSGVVLCTFCLRCST